MPEVAVIGGSIAGLSTGIALRCLGCDVQVYEASPTILRGRGGGLVVQFEMLDRNGRVIQRFPDSTPFTSWDAVFHQLRAAFPDDTYHHGRQCVGTR